MIILFPLAVIGAGVLLALTGYSAVALVFLVLGAYVLGRFDQSRQAAPLRYRTCDVSIDAMDMIDRREDGHAALASRMMFRARLLLDDLSAGNDPSHAARRLNTALTEAERRKGKKGAHQQ